MNVFNLIAGAGGGSGSGLYIWKKYAYTPRTAVVNPQMTAYNKSSASLWFNSANFDYKAFEQINETLPIKYTDYKDFVDFFDGFVATDGTRFDIEKRVYDTYDSMSINMNGSYGNVNRYVTTDTYFYFGFNGYPTVDGVGRTFAYNGTKYLPAKIGDLIGYVVSDKPDAYPDGAEQGGFYYERLEPLDEGVFGCTKMETGVFVPTQYSALVTVEHSLGVIPKMCLAWQEENASYCSNTWTVFNNAGSGASYAELYSNKTARQYGNAGDGATVTRCPFSAYGNSPAWFGAGLTYHYIIFA